MNHSDLRDYLKAFIMARLETELGIESRAAPLYPQLNDRTTDNSPAVDRFIRENGLNNEETIILLLALMPHLDPGFFQSVIAPYFPHGGDFPEFGGAKGQNHRGILPTGETVLFVLAGSDLEKRMKVLRYFEEDHLFSKKNLISIAPAVDQQPKMSGRLVMDDEYVQLLPREK